MFYKLILSLLFIATSLCAQKVEQREAVGNIVSIVANGNIAVTASALQGDSVRLIISDRFTDVSWMEEGKNALNRQIVLLQNQIEISKDSLRFCTKRAVHLKNEAKKLKGKKGQSARADRALIKLKKTANGVLVDYYKKQLKGQKADLIVLRKADKPYRKAVSTIKWNTAINHKK